MADRDWEKELADIDRRISSVPDEPTPAPAAAPQGRAVAKAAPVAAQRGPAAAPIAAAPATAGRRDWKATVGLLFRVVLTGLLLATVVVWPYETRCGIWLAAYLGTIGATALGGLWTAIAAWRHRAALVHIVGLLMFVAAGVAASLEVLPRVGYAMPDPAHPAIWACQ